MTGSFTEFIIEEAAIAAGEPDTEMIVEIMP